MRYPQRALVLSLFLIAVAASALTQQVNVTDAERMDLAGPVRAVSTTANKMDVAWQQPGGPTLVFPIWCWECEFDPNGNQTKSGQLFNGNFQGETIRLVLDSQGHVAERIAEDPSTGETVRHELIGPFGKIEELSYWHGQLQSQVFFSYDRYGHRIDWLTLDGAGNQVGHTVVSTDKDGNDTEQWDWGKDDQLLLHVRQTFDPKSQADHFTSFNSFGGVNLTWTMLDGKLSSFWEPPGAPSQYGDGFTHQVNDDTSENYQCHNDGACELSRVHYVFLDTKRRNPQSAEWRDASGSLRYAAYYEYEIDAHRNWTHRQIWVWSGALGERKLYEIDSRSISYWPQ